MEVETYHSYRMTFSSPTIALCDLGILLTDTCQSIVRALDLQFKLIKHRHATTVYCSLATVNGCTSKLACLAHTVLPAGMLDSKLLLYAPTSPAASQQHKGIVGDMNFLLHGILEAAVAWVARFKKSGAAQAREDMLIGTWVKQLGLQLMDENAELLPRFMSLSALADMSLLLRSFPAEVHRENEVRNWLIDSCKIVKRGVIERVPLILIPPNISKYNACAALGQERYVLKERISRFTHA